MYLKYRLVLCFFVSQALSKSCHVHVSNMCLESTYFSSSMTTTLIAATIVSCLDAAASELVSLFLLLPCYDPILHREARMIFVNNNWFIHPYSNPSILSYLYSIKSKLFYWDLKDSAGSEPGLHFLLPHPLLLSPSQA